MTNILNLIEQAKSLCEYASQLRPTDPDKATATDAELIAVLDEITTATKPVLAAAAFTLARNFHMPLD